MKRRSDGFKPSPRGAILTLLALILGGTGGISLAPYMDQDAVGVEIKQKAPRKKSPTPKVDPDCYWIIDGRDYKRSIDAYPCIYRAGEDRS